MATGWVSIMPSRVRTPFDVNTPVLEARYEMLGHFAAKKAIESLATFNEKEGLDSFEDFVLQ